MTRTIVLALVILLSCSCSLLKNTPVSGTDSYSSGRSVIQAAQISLVGADGIFELWASLAPADKASNARKTYFEIRSTVVDGLKVALDAVDLAASLSQGFDIVKLLAQAESAWHDLYAFLQDLGVAKDVPPMISTEKGSRPGPTLQNLPSSLLPKNKPTH